MILDYILTKECKNKEAWFTCLKCGKCGRVFEYGYMVDDGGTTIEQETEQITCKQCDIPDVNCYGQCKT